MRSLQIQLFQVFTDGGHARVQSPVLVDAASISAVVENLPCGGITEIHGGVSAGKTTLAYAIIAAALRDGGFAAWIDVSNAFDPRFAGGAGIDLDRVLWIAPVDHLSAVRAAEHILEAGGFRVVVLDFGGSSVQAPSRLSMAVWLRIDRTAALRKSAIVVLDPMRSVAAFATLSLEVRADRRVFSGEHGPCPLFEGATSCVRVRQLGEHRPLIFFATRG